MLVKDLKKGDRLFCIPVWIEDSIDEEFVFEIYEIKRTFEDDFNPSYYHIKLYPIIGMDNPYLVLPENVELNDIVATKYTGATWIWTANEEIAITLFEAFSKDNLERIMNIYFYLDGYFDMKSDLWCTDLESIYD